MTSTALQAFSPNFKRATSSPSPWPSSVLTDWMGFTPIICISSLSKYPVTDTSAARPSTFMWLSRLDSSSCKATCTFWQPPRTWQLAVVISPRICDSTLSFQADPTCVNPIQKTAKCRPCSERLYSPLRLMVRLAMGRSAHSVDALYTSRATSLCLACHCLKQKNSRSFFMQRLSAVFVSIEDGIKGTDCILTDCSKREGLSNPVSGWREMGVQKSRFK